MHDGAFVLVTLHRPSNVDAPEQLQRLGAILAELARDLPVVFPMHLRTRARLSEESDLWAARGLLVTDPLGYLEFLGLMTQAAAVVTDSGGVQEETSVLGVPCVTVRTTTERPITVTQGTNRLADPLDKAAILSTVRAAVEQGIAPPPVIPLWDGHAGVRVVAALACWSSGSRRSRGRVPD